MVKQNEDGMSMKIWHALIVGTVVGFLGGVGAMQATIVGDVRDNKVNVAHMAEELKETNASVNGRMDRVTKLMEQILETNRQLVAELVAERNRELLAR